MVWRLWTTLNMILLIILITYIIDMFMCKCISNCVVIGIVRQVVGSNYPLYLYYIFTFLHFYNKMIATNVYLTVTVCLLFSGISSENGDTFRNREAFSCDSAMCLQEIY